MNSKYLQFKQFLGDWYYPNYRYTQLLQAIFIQKIHRFEEMMILPLALRNKLITQFGESVCCLQPSCILSSKQVHKTLFALSDGKSVETIHLQYQKGRNSFCISSQVGCGFKCSFCATGAVGFKRNLTVDGITDQLLYLYLQGHRLDSIAFMGMGEPLANPYLFDALEVLTHPHLFALSQRRITLSTIGIVPKIYALTEQFPQVHLTFSLHSPFDEQRTVLMPVNEIFPLSEVMKALSHHVMYTGKKMYLAYILLRGVNDSLLHAQGIVDLLCQYVGQKKFLYHVDLISYNETDKTSVQYEQSGKQYMHAFILVLQKHDIVVTVRIQF